MSGLQQLTAVQESLARARDLPNVFLQMTPARAGADAQDPAHTGALLGVPFAVKDVFDVRGTRTSAASQVFDDVPHAQRDAEAVRRITAAGAALIGKTTMSELAYSGVGVNERFGTPTITRAGREYVAGGSSSGSASAVHAGVVAFALASDTSGSARIPAAWTGVFGFRPSLGRYPSAGMTPLAPTLDTAAVVASTLDQIESVDQILAAEPAPETDMPTPTFVVPHDAYLTGCDQHVIERFHADLAGLKLEGHRVVQRRISALDVAARLHNMHVPIVEIEAFSRFHRYLERPGLLSSPVRYRLEQTRARLQEDSGSTLYGAMPSVRRQFAHELGDAILLSPTVEIDAPPSDDVRACPDHHDYVNRRSLRLTMVLSYLDAPSLVVPTGNSAGDNPPSSLQLSSSTGHDRRVLHAARAVLKL